MVRLACDYCGKELLRSETRVKRNNTLMKDPAIRAKVAATQRDRGEGKSYRKWFGLHEHRVIAAEILGRPLRSDEIVHHINGNIRDNRPENLMVVTRAEHALIHWHGLDISNRPTLADLQKEVVPNGARRG